MMMVDREKVIKGLEHCEKQGCDGCPYYPNDDGCRLNQDALALLKEQEDLKERHEILVNHADTMLAMLKERNEKIAVLNRFIEQMPKPTKLLDVFCDGYAKVVRCKDCRYGEPTKNGAGDDCIQCNNDDLWLDGNLNFPDWFCADGERR